MVKTIIVTLLLIHTEMWCSASQIKEYKESASREQRAVQKLNVLLNCNKLPAQMSLGSVRD